MNKEIRKFLIERARINVPIAYGVIMQQLDLDNNKPEHRELLSHELAEISRLEHKKGRPMLSAMAMYVDKKYTGPGFYHLAEELGHGEAKDLERQNYAKNMQQQCFLFWNDEDRFRKNINDIVVINNSDENTALIIPPFFSEEDISFFSKWVNKVYDKTSSEHVEAKDRIMHTVGAKTVHWIQELTRRLPELESFHPRVWQKLGWDDSSGKSKQVVKFKHYSWARLFKEGDRNKDIFFAVQADGMEHCLAYKLDYFFEKTSKLSESQKELCKQLIPDEVTWIEIPSEEFINYSWERLLAETEEFIRENLPLYQEIVESVWSGKVNVTKLTNRLIRRELPNDGVTALPERTFTFEGYEIDWDKRYKEAKDCGKIGEDLVIEYEKKKLIEQGKEELAKEVKKIKDGNGYDIASYFVDGKVKYIEVKSTTGDESTTFPISLNEVQFSLLNAPNYFLYRVFNLNKVARVAEFFEYPGNLDEHFLLEGAQFNAFRKKKAEL
jgi:hypothetical protein